MASSKETSTAELRLLSSVRDPPPSPRCNELVRKKGVVGRRPFGPKPQGPWPNTVGWHRPVPTTAAR